MRMSKKAFFLISLVCLFSFTGCNSFRSDLSSEIVWGEVPSENSLIESTQAGSSESEIKENASMSIVDVSPKTDVDLLTISNYRYNQMSDASKKVFEILSEAIKKHQSIIELDFSATESAVIDAWNEIQHIDEYTLIVNPVEKITWNYNVSNGAVSTISISYLLSADECQQRYSDSIGIIENVVSQTKGFTEYEAAKFFHDYIVLNTEYSNWTNAHSAYGVFVDGLAVCDGYARAYKILCNRAGIQCEIIDGKSGEFGLSDIISSADENHAWNITEFNDEWYHTDVTWDDPTGMPLDFFRYTYFNITAEDMLSDHYVVDFLKLPTANAVDKNYFHASGNIVKTEEDILPLFQAEIPKIIEENRTCINVKFASPALYQMVMDGFSGEVGINVHQYIHDMLVSIGSNPDEFEILYSNDDIRHIIVFQIANIDG